MQTNNKLREACEALMSEIGGYSADGLEIVWCGINGETIRNVRSALAEPVRNCDVGTSDDWLARFSVFCEHCSGSDCDHRLFKDEDVCNCFARWLQMPYKEGDNDENE